MTSLKFVINIHGSWKVTTSNEQLHKCTIQLLPLIWMIHDRYLTTKLNKIHERALGIVYKDTHADYEALLKLDNAMSVHQRNLQA